MHGKVRCQKVILLMQKIWQISLIRLYTVMNKAEYTSQVVIAGFLNHQQYGESTIIQRVLSISGGAGFLLSTVAEFFFSKRLL